jgi:hypothetical protein
MFVFKPNSSLKYFFNLKYDLEIVDLLGTVLATEHVPPIFDILPHFFDREKKMML